MTRDELAIARLTEEWDAVVVLASRYVNGATETLRVIQGNAYTVQGMLDEETQVAFPGGLRDDGEEESEARET